MPFAFSLKNRPKNFNQEPAIEPAPASRPLKPWVDRNGFPRWLVALLWSVIAWVLFQLTGAVVAITVALLSSGGTMEVTDLMEVLTTRLEFIFIGNSLSQLAVLGGLTVLIARASEGRTWKEGLRFRLTPSAAFMSLLAAVLMVAAQPLVLALGWLNLQIPLPENYLAFEKAQNLMLENYLRGDHVLAVTLIHVALVPAFCEELMMRGLLFRLFERTSGVVGALIFSSLIFGLFHIRLTQVIPLAFLGFLMAWSVLKSGSLLPAMVAHLVNNGTNVVLARYYPEFVFEEFTPEHPPEWTLVLAGFVVTGAVMLLMHKKREAAVAVPES